MRRARTVIGFAALSLAVVAFSGSAVGLPGTNDDDPVTLAASPDRLEILRCIGYEALDVGLHNTTAEGQYADVFFRPTGPLKVSRSVFSSYVPAGLDVSVPLKVSVPPDAAPGDYELGYDVGARVHAATPVRVVADPAKQCVPSARMKATATSQQANYEASKAIDGNPATFWHSQFSPALPLPQAITVDLGGVYDLSELRYRPRSDGNLTGNITGYTITASTDGKAFAPVVSGTWSEDDSPKTATFDAPGVRSIRLTATSGRLDLAAIAELVPLGKPVDVPDISAAAMTVPLTLVAGRPADIPVSVGNWTAAPLEVEASITVPSGWSTTPRRVTIPAGAVIGVNVPVTPPAGFPAAGLQPAVTLTGHAAPVAGGRSDGAPTATTWVAPDPAKFELALDSGTTTAPLMAGWERLSPSDPWKDGARFGWVGTAPDSRDRGGLDDLRRDFTLSTAETTLRVVLPPGVHDVALLRGDATGSSGSTLLKLDGQTLVAPGGNLTAGQFAWERFTLDGGALGRSVDLKISNNTGSNWRIVALAMAPKPVTTTGEVGATVPATLSLTLGAPASFGTFLPGVARVYSAATTATVTSTGGDAVLTVTDPDTSAPGRLVNGAFALAAPLQVAGAPLPSRVREWAAPVAGDPVTIAFEQPIGATEPLRTGTYAKSLTFTVSTTTP